MYINNSMFYCLLPKLIQTSEELEESICWKDLNKNLENKIT